MPMINHENVLELVDYVKIDSFSIVCHFKCKETNKRVVSAVPFEPYDGKIELSWKEILLHPIRSYNKYYHTPITIYGADCHDTIVLKAFKKVSKHFKWNAQAKKYTCI